MGLSEVKVSKVEAPNRMVVVPVLDGKTQKRRTRMQEQMNQYFDNEALGKWHPDIVNTGDFVAVKVSFLLS